MLTLPSKDLTVFYCSVRKQPYKRIIIIPISNKSHFLFLMTLIFFFIISSSTTRISYAQEIHTPTDKCDTEQQNVIFKPLTIFDENEKGFIFIHRWANAIHIDTKQITLENEATFFIEKCAKNFSDMAELERHLRSRKYLRDAKVTSDENVENITVTTWDNWSLMPTISFGRKGGESTYSFGIKERNLLGLGIDAEIETYRNSQRKGYKLKTTIPLFSKNNIDLKLRFSDNDDGTQQSLFLQKHFASFYTDHAYQFGFDEESRNDTLYQNDSELAIFSHNISYKNAEYAWLKFNSETSLVRYRVGITQDFHEFAYTNDGKNNPNSSLLPKDRDFIYPWIGIDYIEKNFRKLINIHLITQIEDFNHGWQFSSRLGVSDGKKSNSAWALFEAEVNKGFEIHDDALVLMNIALSGNIYDQQDYRILLNIDTEYFYNFNSHWGFYFNNTNVISDNQYIDKPVTVGGSNGLRGFPLGYQHGQHSVNFTTEIRYYPYINLFKLFDLAGAAFLDTARTYGSTEALGSQDNIENGWLYSIGIGARLYSPHSAGNHQVIHIDFAFPQGSNADINTFEVRIEAKQSF